MRLSLLGLLAALLLNNPLPPRFYYFFVTCEPDATVYHFTIAGREGQTVDKVHIEIDGKAATVPDLDPALPYRAAMNVDVTGAGHPLNPVLTGGALVDGQEIGLENPGAQPNQCAAVIYLPVVSR